LGIINPAHPASRVTAALVVRPRATACRPPLLRPLRRQFPSGLADFPPCSLRLRPGEALDDPKSMLLPNPMNNCNLEVGARLMCHGVALSGFWSVRSRVPGAHFHWRWIEDLAAIARGHRPGPGRRRGPVGCPLKCIAFQNVFVLVHIQVLVYVHGVVVSRFWTNKRPLAGSGFGPTALANAGGRAGAICLP
jgi:hypothetical protein